MSREDIPNVLIRLTNVTGFDHTQEASLAFKEATEEIERLLADERKSMECGHPKVCWIQPEPEPEEIMHYVTHDMAVDAEDRSLEGQPMPETIWHEKEPYCSGCAEREKVREMCARACERESSDPPTEEANGFMEGCHECEDAIRQLDLTKLDEGGEEK